MTQPSQMPLLLNLGCGDRTHNAWVNIDHSPVAVFRRLPWARHFGLAPLPPGYRNYDLRRGIPARSGSVDVIYSSHVLEHIPHRVAPDFIRDIFRCLKPGGVVRIVVPDLETTVRTYVAALEALRDRPGDLLAQERYEWSVIWLLDQQVRSELGGEMALWLRSHRDSPVVKELRGNCAAIAASHPPTPIQVWIKRLLGLTNPGSRGELHRWMYDSASLRALLSLAGFEQIEQLDHLRSRIAGWREFLLDANVDGSAHQPGSLWFEACKP
jgi:SAM-dependent methyltransferase